RRRFRFEPAVPPERQATAVPRPPPDEDRTALRWPSTSAARFADWLQRPNSPATVPFAAPATAIAWPTASACASCGRLLPAGAATSPRRPPTGDVLQIWRTHPLIRCEKPRQHRMGHAAYCQGRNE